MSIPVIPLTPAQQKRQAERLASVRPELVRAYEVALGRWLGDRELMLLGRPFVTFGHRSNAVQDALYAQGRETLAKINALRKKASLDPIDKAEAGRIVTYQKGGQSKHNASPSNALDVAHLQADGSVKWDSGALLLFSRLMRAADPVVVWGADWDQDGNVAEHSFKDFPHYQYGR